MNSEFRIGSINPNPQNPQRNPFNNSDENEEKHQEQQLMEETQEDSFVMNKNRKLQNTKENKQKGFIEKLKTLIGSLLGFGEIVDNRKTENV